MAVAAFHGNEQPASGGIQVLSFWHTTDGIYILGGKLKQRKPKFLLNSSIDWSSIDQDIELHMFFKLGQGIQYLPQTIGNIFPIPRRIKIMDRMFQF